MGVEGDSPRQCIGIVVRVKRNCHAHGVPSPASTSAVAGLILLDAHQRSLELRGACSVGNVSRQVAREVQPERATRETQTTAKKRKKEFARNGIRRAGGLGMENGRDSQILLGCRLRVSKERPQQMSVE